jgi:hypothetical protein
MGYAENPTKLFSLPFCRRAGLPERAAHDLA